MQQEMIQKNLSTILELNEVFTNFFIAISQLPYALHSKQIKESKTMETTQRNKAIVEQL